MKRTVLFLLFFCCIPFSVFGEGFLEQGAPSIPGAPEVRRGYPDFSSLIDSLTGTVVNISVEIEESDDKGESALPEGQFFKKGPGRSYYSAGSGFVVSSEGHIATCNHVIERAGKVVIRFADDNNDYPATVVGTDPKTDLALLKIKPKKKLKTVFVGESDKLRVGEWVIAVGNQFQLGQTVTAGIVSAKSRRVPAKSSGPYDAFIQTDASINPGSSGGPLFNSQGQVVGVNTAIYSPGRGQLGGPGFNIGIGFAVPMDLAKGVLEQLKNQGKVTRGLLGVIIQKIDPRVSGILKLDSPQGALVADVVSDSPAERAGAKRGDVITKFNGQEVRDHDDLPLMVANTKIGSVVAMDIVRDGVNMQLHPKITVLSDDKAGVPVQDIEDQMVANEIGLYTENLTKELAATFKLPVDKGVLIKGVEPGSTGERAGVIVGDIVEEVNRQKITSAEQLAVIIAELKTDSAVLMLVRRKEGTRYLTFEIER